ncbi:PEP/pyruvate-binding domain-containing protein [Actinophytocola sp.]|uniref:PEP/pyruvate-binding domain-containing protein n=1 Tax=Actinophytocola sp. TaxID=1872138 RepID=UPI002EDAE456
MALTVLRPGDAALLDPTRVGHKFARQERLRQAGFPVPELHCVPVDEFDAVMRERSSAPPAGTPEQEVLDWSRTASAALAANPLPGRLADEVLRAFDSLRDDEPTEDTETIEAVVAVRACVVADEHGAGEDGGEDSAGDAFAGLTESFLYVRRPDVPRRVAGCWASGLRPESVGYRTRRGLAPSSARVAVAIQRMVLGVRSFVAFSRDPRTREEVTVIAAAHGIGEGVVQERADIDHFFVDAATAEVRAELVTKKRMVAPGADGFPATLPVPPESAERPVLTDDECRRVATLAAEVEAFFGSPQDIEGTIDAAGSVHLVQARPVVFAGTGRDAPVIQWSNRNVTESFPGVSGALTFSQARVFYRLIFRDAYRRLGVPQRRLRTAEHHLNRMIGLLDGRVHYRLDAWFALHGQLPGFALMRPWWEKSMGLPAGERATRGEKLRALRALPALAVRLILLPRSVHGFLRWWDGFVTRYDGMDGWSPEELIAGHRRLWAEVGDRWGVTLANSFFMLSSATAVSALLRRWLAVDEHEIVGGLLLGGRENRSVRGVRSAIRLAELAGCQPRFVDRIRSADPDEVWRELVGGEYGAELADAAREHLRHYGDRGLHDLKLEQISPRQRPGMIVETLRPMIENGLTVADSRAREAASRAEVDRDLRRRCPSRVRRLLIRALVAALRWFVTAREDTRFCRSQLFGLSRHLLWRLGDHLVDAGRLGDRSDVFDLTVEEVFGAYDGTLVDADLREVARRRRAARLAAAGRPDLDAAPATPLDRPVPEEWPDRGEPAAARNARAELHGLPSSKGKVRYPAKVVLDPNIGADSCRDRIIVAKETDPGWLFLMMAARGMVVERGTLLSHTAITGRLLGIPTVVSVPDATALIRDDDLLEIDGETGTVRVLGE